MSAPALLESEPSFEMAADKGAAKRPSRIGDPDAAALARMRASDPRLASKAFDVRDLVLDWCGDLIGKAGARVLDFGCGDGETAFGIARSHPRAEIYGIDLTTSEAALRARVQAVTGDEPESAAWPSNLVIRQIDAGELPRFGGLYDLVYSWSVMEHVHRDILDAMLGDIRDAMADEGRLFIQIAPLYYSAFGHHVAWERGYEWTHLSEQLGTFDRRLEDATASEAQLQNLRGCYDTLNRVTATELKERLEAAGFLIERQHRDMLAGHLPRHLLHAYRREALETEQVVLLCRKRAGGGGGRSVPSANASADARTLERVDGQQGGLISHYPGPAASGRVDPLSLSALAAGLHAPAVLALGGWTSDLPDIGLGFGRSRFEWSEDVARCEEALGSLHDYTVLQLGAGEGDHSHALEKAGARVLAIEPAFESYLRCLHVRNQYDLAAKFVHGEPRDLAPLFHVAFDLVFVSGDAALSDELPSLMSAPLERADRIYARLHGARSEAVVAVEATLIAAAEAAGFEILTGMLKPSGHALEVAARRIRPAHVAKGEA